LKSQAKNRKGATKRAEDFKNGKKQREERYRKPRKGKEGKTTKNRRCEKLATAGNYVWFWNDLRISR
jgi:hypothetical protein